MPNGLAVAVRGLRIRRGAAQVFDGLDLEIPRGRIVGVLGPSGCGKSTLLRAIVGAQRVHGGTIQVLGERAGSPRLRAVVAYDPQSTSVYTDLTVEQNLRYFGRLLSAPREDVAQVIDRVDLEAQAGQLVGSLSGGQQKRVSLGVALLGRPELVVLDEPTVGLDPVLRDELWDVFRALADTGVTLIVTSHVMDEALRCDRVVLLREGRVIADTTPAALLAETGTTEPDRAFLTLIERDRA